MYEKKLVLFAMQCNVIEGVWRVTGTRRLHTAGRYWCTNSNSNNDEDDIQLFVILIFLSLAVYFKLNETAFREMTD